MPVATLQTVADALGISAMTVSRCLNAPEAVAPATLRRVMSEVARQGYRPNPAARSLATASTPVVAVIIPSLSNQVFADLVRGVGDTLGEQAPIQVINTQYDEAVEANAMDRVAQQNYRGAIVVSQTHPLDYDEHDRPIVSVLAVQGEDVVFDYADAIEQAFRHFHQLGATRIADLSAGSDPRVMARRQACQRLGSQPFSSPHISSVAVGRQLMASVLAQGDFDAVLCHNDDLALGALFECQARGLAVPGQIKICGFNDLDFAQHCFPALSSIRVPRYQMGQAAARKLLGQPHQSFFSGRLIARQSTACV